MNWEGICHRISSLWLALLSLAFNAAGASLLDPSFQLDPRVKGTIDIVTIQADGRILIAGVFTNFTAKEYALLLRLDSTGRIDPTFEPLLEQPSFEPGLGFGVTSPITDVHCQGNGQTVVGRQRLLGWPFPSAFTSIDILDSNGHLSFHTGASGYLKLAIDRHDQIVAAGRNFVIQGTGTISTIVLQRFSKDGFRDGGVIPPPEFAYKTLAHSVTVGGIQIARNGDILLAGQFYMQPPSIFVQPETCALRLQENGTLIWKYPDGALSYGAKVVSEDEAGRICLGKYGSIERLTSDGKPEGDSTFLAYGQWNGKPQFLLEPGGRIILTRHLNSKEGVRQIGLTGILVDNTSDLTFDSGSGFTNDGLNPAVNSLARQSDGMILVGGSFRTFDGITRPSLVRIFPRNPESKTVLTVRRRPAVIELEWPVEESGYGLESLDSSEGGGLWRAHAANVIETDRVWTVTVPVQSESQLFRLKK